jgi:hypothetical protein
MAVNQNYVDFLLFFFGFDSRSSEKEVESYSQELEERNTRGNNQIHKNIPNDGKLCCQIKMNCWLGKCRLNSASSVTNFCAMLKGINVFVREFYNNWRELKQLVNRHRYFTGR